MAFIDDNDIAALFALEASRPPQDWWAEGQYMTADGLISLEDMTQSHLKNAIRYWESKGIDTSILQDLLKK